MHSRSSLANTVERENQGIAKPPTAVVSVNLQHEVIVGLKLLLQKAILVGFR